MILAAWEWYTVLFVVIWILSSISDYKKRKRLKEQREQQEAARRAAAQKAQSSSPSPTPSPTPRSAEIESEESFPKQIILELPQSHPQAPKTPAPITYRVDDEFKQAGEDFHVFEDEESGTLQVAKPTRFRKLADREARQVRKDELLRNQVAAQISAEENWARAFALGEALAPPLVKRPKRGASSRWI